VNDELEMMWKEAAVA